jgi:Tfp pilus assembly protein PilX
MNSRHGIAMVLTLAALLAVTLVAGALVKSLLLSHRQSKRYAEELQAQWLAEAGLARATAQLAASQDYTGETWQAPVGGDEEFGRVTIRIQPAEGEAPQKILVEAVYPPREHDRILVTRELLLNPEP